MATLNKSLAARSASPYAFSFVGAALMVSSYLMQSMLPLRIVALLACLCLAVYGYLGAALPTVLLYGALIPINIKKTWQIHQLVRAIEHARSDTPVSQCLLAHLTRRSATAGQVLWRKGDMATWRHGDMGNTHRRNTNDS